MNDDNQEGMSCDKAEAGVDLRHMFIAMLFAFAIENVFSTVFSYTFGENSGSLPLLTIILHAIFLVFVIASSWIKWSEASKGASLEGPKDHQILTIDILVLFVYFLMVNFIAEDVRYILAANVAMAFLYLLWDLRFNDVKPSDLRISFYTYSVSLYFLLSSLLLIGFYYAGLESKNINQILLILLVVFYRYKKG